MSTTAPRWDLTPWFAGLTTDAYRAAFAASEADAERLSAAFAQASPLDESTLEDWAARLVDLEYAQVRFNHLWTYVRCLTSTDADDADAKREDGAAGILGARFTALSTQLEAQVSQCTEAVFEAFCSLNAHQDIQYTLKRMRARAARRLAPEMEQLVSDLAIDGFHAWGQLYNEITGGLEFDLKGESTPLAWRRSLLQDSDPSIRAEAFSKSNEALEAHGDTLAATLNAIAGRRITVQRWRGVDDVLGESVFSEGMTRASLDTMLSTVKSRRGLAQEYLRLKAKLLGESTIAFSDLGAPLDLGEDTVYSWDEARSLVLRAFGAYHPDLEAFATEMFALDRIEAEARRGKRAGAYCTGSKLDQTARVFMTFRGTLGDVVTLAHELGHAYHHAVMAGMRSWACRYPASLAETASILAETLVGDLLLNDPKSSATLQLQVLEKRLHSAAIYMLNIPMRFEFEDAFYRRRETGPVSAQELCNLMHETQISVYGSALDSDRTDPWFWASKLHFFLTGISFYNFPYTFGYLFSTGVLAEARREGPAVFHPRLTALLEQTGSDSVEGVARDSLGVDLGSPDFWNASLDQVEADLERFKALVSKLT
jgi:oligoendopeptidase F